MENEKVIDGVSMSKWNEAFAICLANAFSNDDFSDLLFYDLYPNTHEEASALGEDEEAIDDVYNSKWNSVYKAFLEIFGKELFIKAVGRTPEEVIE